MDLIQFERLFAVFERIANSLDSIAEALTAIQEDVDRAVYAPEGDEDFALQVEIVEREVSE